MSVFLPVALKAVKQGGDIIKKSFGRATNISLKDNLGRDFVTDCDKKTEKTILNIIQKKFPNHNILAEESGNKKTNNNYRWILDPLDGTTNLIKGFPYLSISLALEKNNELILGIVYNPLTNKLYWAEKDLGAKLNNKKITVSKINKLDKSFVAINWTRSNKAIKNTAGQFKKFLPKVQKMRVFGSVALTLAEIAEGKFDAMIINEANWWDIAAGCLLIKEAGGQVTDNKKIPLENNSKPLVIASNKKLHNAIIRIIK